MLEKLKEIVVLVGEKLLDQKKETFFIKNKKDEFDYVTELDLKTQKSLQESLKKEFGDIPFFAEENGYDKKPESSEYWLIDPIDGTVNFSKGFPEYCISVAYIKDNEVEIGVIFAPQMNMLFYAEKNKGAYLNNEKIYCSKENELNKSMILLSNFRGVTYKYVETLEKEVLRLRLLGTAALQICYVAAGYCEAFISLKAFPWDIAAGFLILKEAGGVVKDLNEKEVDFFESKSIFSNKFISPDLIKKVKNL